MKKLNTDEIKQFANALSFTESEAKDITDLFYNLKMQDPIINWRILSPLDNVDEYIKEWENHWHREINIEECFKYERDEQYYSYNPLVAKEIFTSIEAFKKHAMHENMQYVYQLPHNDMVVVVC